MTEQGIPLVNVVPYKRWNGSKIKAALQKALKKWKR